VVVGLVVLGTGVGIIGKESIRVRLFSPVTCSLLLPLRPALAARCNNTYSFAQRCLQFDGAARGRREKRASKLLLCL